MFHDPDKRLIRGGRWTQKGRLPYAERVLNMLNVLNPKPYRVVQWTTGNVGKSSVQALASNPNYEIVGCAFEVWKTVMAPASALPPA